MKKSIKNTTVLIFLSLSLCCVTACKKSFLDISPKGKIIAKDVADYDHLLNNFQLINSDASAQLFMGDDVIATDPYFSGAPLRNQRLFRYEAEIYEPNQDANETAVILPQIYNYNKVINEISNATNGTEDQKRAILSDALASRAWCFFMLINYYGKPYNESTAKSDPCCPIITQADVTRTSFNRGTVQEMYDQIIGDLKKSIPYINTKPFSNVRMSKCAAEALLGKVLIFMGKYNEALPYLKSAFDDLPTNLNNTLSDYNILMQPGGPWGYDPIASQTSFTFGMPTIWNDPESIYAKQMVLFQSFEAADMLMNTETLALFGPSDMRLNLFSPQGYGGGSFPQVPGALRRTGPISTPIGITMPELYLLLAECKARTSDLDGAKTALVTFRKSRMPEADAAVNISDQTTLIKFVIEERKREFALKGYRWFDMRRLSTDPIFSTTQYKHTYVDGTGKVTFYPLPVGRLTMRIPAKIINENPGLGNNP
jgi:tetratricopeptide (TPR) repeat protein